MKIYISLIFGSIIFSFNLFCQDEVSYIYDDSGNRIEKILIIGGLKSVSLKESTKTTSDFSEMIDNVTVHLYPNPTKGKINLVIMNATINSRIFVSVFNINGSQIFAREINSGNTEINLIHESPGTYFLKIQVNDHESKWKIIKQ